MGISGSCRRTPPRTSSVTGIRRTRAWSATTRSSSRRTRRASPRARIPELLPRRALWLHQLRRLERVPAADDFDRARTVDEGVVPGRSLAVLGEENATLGLSGVSCRPRPTPSGSMPGRDPGRRLQHRDHPRRQSAAPKRPSRACGTHGGTGLHPFRVSRGWCCSSSSRSTSSSRWRSEPSTPCSGTRCPSTSRGGGASTPSSRPRRFYAGRIYFDPLVRTLLYVAAASLICLLAAMRWRTTPRGTPAVGGSDPGAADLAVLDQLPDADLRVAEPVATRRIRQRCGRSVRPVTGHLDRPTHHRRARARVRLHPVHDPAAVRVPRPDRPASAGGRA